MMYDPQIPAKESENQMQNASFFLANCKRLSLSVFFVLFSRLNTTGSGVCRKLATIVLLLECPF